MYIYLYFYRVLWMLESLFYWDWDLLLCLEERWQQKISKFRQRSRKEDEPEKAHHTSFICSLSFSV